MLLAYGRKSRDLDDFCFGLETSLHKKIRFCSSRVESPAWFEAKKRSGFLPIAQR